jgi:hypothetical protein
MLGRAARARAFSGVWALPDLSSAGEQPERSGIIEETAARNPPLPTERLSSVATIEFGGGLTAPNPLCVPMYAKSQYWIQRDRH